MKLVFYRTTDLKEVVDAHGLVTGKEQSIDRYKYHLLHPSFKESFFGLLIKRGDDLIGYISSWIYHIDGDPEQYTVNVFLKDTSVADEVVNKLISELQKRNCKKLITFCTDKSLWQKIAIEKHGPVHVLTHVESEFDLINDSIDNYILPVGYQIKTFRELEAVCGEKVYDHTYPLLRSVMYDIPGCSEQADNLTVEKLKMVWSGDGFFKDACLFIQYGDELVALHNVFSRVKHEVEAGMTGVLTYHRRKGLMNALKLYGMKWAKEQGYKRFNSSNEKDNPMLALNYNLGFKKTVESYSVTLLSLASNVKND